MCAALLLPNSRDAFLRLSQLPSLRDRRFYSFARRIKFLSMYKIPILPLKEDLESKAVLRQVAKSHRRLAELKGAVLCE